MSYDFIQQGWQCPICRRVYSPMTPMCWYCGSDKEALVTNAYTPIEKIWKEHMVNIDMRECPVCGRKVKKGELCECEKDGIET